MAQPVDQPVKQRSTRRTVAPTSGAIVNHDFSTPITTTTTTTGVKLRPNDQPAEDSHGSRSKEDVPVPRRQPNSEADRDRR